MTRFLLMELQKLDDYGHCSLFLFSSIMLSVDSVYFTFRYPSIIIYRFRAPSIRMGWKFAYHPCGTFDMFLNLPNQRIGDMACRESTVIDFIYSIVFVDLFLLFNLHF